KTKEPSLVYCRSGEEGCCATMSSTVRTKSAANLVIGRVYSYPPMAAMTFLGRFLPSLLWYPREMQRRIVFAAVPPVQILDVTGPFEVFANCGGYQLEFVSNRARKSVQASCGLSLGEAKDYRKLRGAIDTLLIAGGPGARTMTRDPA